LISLLDVRYKIYLGCSSRDSGKRVKDICSVGCIACGRCEKKDPKAAVVLKDNLPVLDFEKAAGDFTVAAESCPMGCFVVEGKSELAAAAPKQAEQVG
jgi:ferredoxin